MSDVGHTIRVGESASNAGGTSAAVSSAPTGVVASVLQPATPPSNSIAPQIVWIAGVSPVPGQRLSASTGTWSGTPPLSYGYEWQACRPACAKIAGATAASYTVAAADVGARLRIVVTAANGAGEASAASALVGPVIAGPEQLRASLLNQIAPRGKAARIGSLLRTGYYRFRYTALGAGTLIIFWYLVPSGAHLSRPNPRPILIASGRKTFRKRGSATVTVALTATGRRRLAHVKRVKLTAKGFFNGAHVGSPTVLKTFTLTR